MSFENQAIGSRVPKACPELAERLNTGPGPPAGELWRIGRLWRTLSPRRNLGTRTLSAHSAHVYPKDIWTIRPSSAYLDSLEVQPSPFGKLGRLFGAQPEVPLQARKNRSSDAMSPAGKGQSIARKRANLRRPRLTFSVCLNIQRPAHPKAVACLPPLPHRCARRPLAYNARPANVKVPLPT